MLAVPQSAWLEMNAIWCISERMPPLVEWTTRNGTRVPKSLSADVKHPTRLRRLCDNFARLSGDGRRRRRGGLDARGTMLDKSQPEGQSCANAEAPMICSGVRSKRPIGYTA